MGDYTLIFVDFQECEIRNRFGHQEFARWDRDIFPFPYPEIVGILDQGARSVYDKGVCVSPRIRGLPYNMASSDQTELIATKLWRDISARRIFVCTTGGCPWKRQLRPTTLQRRGGGWRWWGWEPGQGGEYRSSRDIRYEASQRGILGIVVLPGARTAHRIYSAVVGVHDRVPTRLRYRYAKEGYIIRFSPSEVAPGAVATYAY